MFQTKSIAFFALPFASILLLDLEKYFKGVSSLSPHQALVGSGREVQDWVQMVCVCLCHGFSRVVAGTWGIFSSYSGDVHLKL